MIQLQVSWDVIREHQGAGRPTGLACNKVINTLSTLKLPGRHFYLNGSMWGRGGEDPFHDLIYDSVKCESIRND